MKESLRVSPRGLLKPVSILWLTAAASSIAATFPLLRASIVWLSFRNKDSTRATSERGPRRHTSARCRVPTDKTSLPNRTSKLRRMEYAFTLTWREKHKRNWTGLCSQRMLARALGLRKPAAHLCPPERIVAAGSPRAVGSSKTCRGERRL